MKKLNLFFLVLALMVGFTSVASAQTTAQGTLTVTAIVNGQINLVFNTDAQGVTLTGSGTSTATLDFGTISAFGALASPKITRTFTSGVGFTVSTPIDVFVDKSNVTSANYQLTAKLNAPDTNYNWSVGGIGINSTTPITITATGTYTTNLQEVIAINVPVGAPSGNINNSIAFVATAN